MVPRTDIQTPAMKVCEKGFPVMAYSPPATDRHRLRELVLFLASKDDRSQGSVLEIEFLGLPGC